MNGTGEPPYRVGEEQEAEGESSEPEAGEAPTTVGKRVDLQLCCVQVWATTTNCKAAGSKIQLVTGCGDSRGQDSVFFEQPLCCMGL